MSVLIKSIFGRVKKTRDRIHETAKKKRIDVAAGKSISVKALTGEESESEDADEVEDDSEEDDTSGDEEEGSCSEEETSSETADESENDANTCNLDPPIEFSKLKKSDFVLVELIYDKGTKKEHAKKFVAQVIEIKRGSHVNLNFLRRSAKASNIFTFPNIKDEGFVENHQIKRILTPIFEKRGRFAFSVEDKTE
ncbi:unnamed protein product [Bemisia tabaci]|uniref:Uncharacterized protein n=1 Tax=Bemisia tabaci TaxID=7038 RepID=A0A9P0A8R3_BEMTA|nr:unnamed protein product [Bemisia tabaci]